jgi:DNA-binding response OmpR family regulator
MSGSRRQASVLIVDPDAAVREILQIRLTLAGYRPRACATVAAADRELQAARPDLLVIEAQSGASEVIGMLRAAHRNPAAPIPSLVIGRRFSKSLLAQLMGLGVQDCVLKPFAATDVLERAERILNPRDAAPMARAYAYID